MIPHRGSSAAWCCCYSFISLNSSSWVLVSTQYQREWTSLNGQFCACDVLESFLFLQFQVRTATFLDSLSLVFVNPSEHVPSIPCYLSKWLFMMTDRVNPEIEADDCNNTALMGRLKVMELNMWLKAAIVQHWDSYSITLRLCRPIPITYMNTRWHFQKRLINKKRLAEE